jgi:hypothetical protein
MSKNSIIVPKGEYMEYITVIVTLGGLGWLIARQEKLFDKIEAIGNRLNRLEEKVTGLENRMTTLESRMAHLEGMLQVIVGTLLGNKTGS